MDCVIAFTILGFAIVGFCYIIASILTWLENRAYKKAEDKKEREKEFISKIAMKTSDFIFDRYIQKMREDIDAIKKEGN